MQAKVSPKSSIVCSEMLDLGEALEDEVIEKLKKIKNINLWIYIAQNFVYSVSPIPAFSILVINKQILHIYKHNIEI